MIRFHYNSSKNQGQLLGCPETLRLLRNHFSVKNPGAFFAKKAGKHAADRKYAITPTGLFNFGMFLEIRKYLTELQIIDIEYTPEFKQRLKCGFHTESVYDEFKFKLRYFQTETIQKALRMGFGTIVIGTGGGKSLTTAGLIENIWKNHQKSDFKCVISVPGISLVSQLMSDFTNYGVGFTFSSWGKDAPLQDTNVVITNSENLNLKFDDNPWLKDIDVFVVDECHKCGSDSDFANKCTKIKTPHKFGFTGTLPKDIMAQWKVLGLLGPVIYEKNSKELRDEGFISNASVKILKLIHPKRKRESYQEELDYIYNCSERNELIKKLVSKLDKNSLILVNHLEHGRNLLEILSQIDNRQVFFIEGGTELEQRDRIKKLMEHNDDIVLVAMSGIFATGISINNIHYVMLVGYGKSFIRIVQSIGRGLRLHPDKKKLTIIDVCDNIHYSSSHAMERQSIYDSEQIQWKEHEIVL